MKKTLLVALTTLAALLALTATAERKIWMYSHSGNHLSMDVTDLDSISFEEPGVLELDPEQSSLPSAGGVFSITITASRNWTARVSDPTTLTLSAYSGTGGTGCVTISGKVSANADNKAYTAIVTVTLDGGVSKYVQVTVAGNTTPTGEKCSALEYPQITIDTQVWMAENYRCSIYDTESEAYKDGLYTVPISDVGKYTPYYTDASNRGKWGSSVSAGNLNGGEIARLGYLYNWAAAVGVADGENQTTAFSGNRQGICPNGWHIPSRADWQALVDYIEKTAGNGIGKVGKHLKTTAGWYSGDSKYKQGLNSYGFAALPAGDKCGGCTMVEGVGRVSGFWTATPHENYGVYAYYRYLTYAEDYMYEDSNSKSIAQSVRCLRDNESPTPTGILSIVPAEKVVSYNGEQITINITSNTDWTASSNKSWATLSKMKGTGNASVIVTIVSDINAKADTAIVTCTTSLGRIATFKVYRVGHTGTGDYVFDINGKSYPTIWINGQNWMAENLKCNKYDTQSESYKEGKYTISTSFISVYTPYYTAIPNGEKPNHITNEQFGKLGYLYNWAAAVGVADGQKQTTSFSGNRQGICPNGWHVPTTVEWDALAEYIDKTKDKQGNYVNVGKYLKTTSGWYNDINGSDSYGFAALPAGYANGGFLYNVGYHTYFWTATHSSDGAYFRYLEYPNYNLFNSNDGGNYGRSVRCIRD